MGLIITAVVLFLIFAFLIGLYNGLVRLQNQVKNAWAQIDVQLKRRHDLIPNLLNTVKGYAKHEKETLENVTRARNQATQASGVAQQAQAENMLTSALSKLLAVVEAYPDLKANQNFLALQEELSSTENKIAFSRQFYNDIVMQYNIKIETVPSNIVASIFNFKQEEMFEIEDAAEREVPTVNFD